MAGGNADNHSHYATSSQPLAPYWRAVFNAMDRAEAAEKHASEVPSLIYTINQIRAEQRAGIFRGWGSDGKYRDVSVPPGVIPGGDVRLVGGGNAAAVAIGANANIAAAVVNFAHRV